MLFAAIDIGSNAVRLYFANIFEKGKMIVAEKASLIRIPVRLGEDVFDFGYVSDEKRKNLIQTITAYKMLIDVYKPITYKACATAAMREASNRNEIIEEIKVKAGIDVKIIDGLEEARIVCATDVLESDCKYKYALYVDVGGGSTEISVVKNHKLVNSNSFRIGTIRMLLKKDEPSEWNRLNEWLSAYSSKIENLICVGSGGNINKLAKIYGNYDERLLTYKNLLKAYQQIKETSLIDRIEKMGMRPDRADVIEPAAQIFINIMEAINAKTIYVPKIGLPDGLIHEMYNEEVSKALYTK